MKLTEEQQVHTHEFGNAIGNLLAKLEIVKFEMDLDAQHLNIILDSNQVNTEKLKKISSEIEKLTEKLNI